jgi:hypothetical protein
MSVEAHETNCCRPGRCVDLEQTKAELASLYLNRNFLFEENKRLRADLARLTKRHIANLREFVESRRGTFGFMIKRHETISQAMQRNYNEFAEERARLNRRLQIMKEMIVNMKMAKFCWCDICVHARGDSWTYRTILEAELENSINAKEIQNGKATKSVGGAVCNTNGLVSDEQTKS